MGRMLIVGCLVLGVGVAQGDEGQIAPKVELSLPEIELQVREAYDSIKTIELDIDYESNIKSYTEPPPSKLPYLNIHFLGTPEKFLVKLDRSYGPALGSSNVFYWDGQQCLGFLNHLTVGVSEGYISHNPDYALSLSPYPLPWNIFTQPTFHHYWFESQVNELSDDLVLIDGQWCYEIQSTGYREPDIKYLEYKTYLDPSIGFMPRRVDKLDPYDSARVIEQKRYLDYKELDIGFWSADRIEYEIYRRTEGLPTRKYLYTVNTIKVNKPIDESRFFVNIPAGVQMYDEQKVQMQQRISNIKGSPIAHALVKCLLIVLVVVSIKVYLTQRNKG